ncbi:MAG: DPP IV N-terminal domain-containing protein [Armatimonadota bacterium]
MILPPTFPGTVLAAPMPAPAAALTPPLTAPRMPALSPDGKRIAFVWRGDIFVASSAGGPALPITSHVESENSPIFSPDGKWIAFASTRHGSSDIFVVPSEGGEVRRITSTSASETPSGWSADGKRVYFSGSRDTPNPSLFSVEISTGRFTKIAEDQQRLGAASASPDGKRLVVTRGGFPWTRPRYHGSGASRLWIIDVASGKRTPLAVDDAQHLWPKWMPGGNEILEATVGEETPNVQWLGRPALRLEDSPHRTPNLWIRPVGAGAKPRQITRFVGSPVRWPSVATISGDIAFEQGTDIWILRKGATEPVRLAFTAPADDKVNSVQRQIVTSADATEAEISPDGKTFLFGLRNDLWTIPVDKPKGRNADDARRLTDWVGFDRDFVWSADGKQVWFVSDRDGNDRLHRLDVDSKVVTPIWTAGDDVVAPKLSPDGKWVGFWAKGRPDTAGLYVVSVDGGSPKRVLAVPAAHQGAFSWSPDMKWLAYTRSSPETGRADVYLTLADGGGAQLNATLLNADHSDPVWSPDGKYLFFGSNRDGDGIYALPLKPEEARIDELEMKLEKPSAPPAVEIDLDDLPGRIRKLVPQGAEELTIGPDGRLVFVSGGDLHVAGFDGKGVAKLTNGGGVSHVRIGADGNTAYFRKGGQLWVARGLAPGAPQTMVSFTALWSRDTRAERKAAFNQFWRAYNANFYDANFHGRDWTAIRARYEPFLEGCATREEFATLLNMMVGELEASHAEVSPAPGTVDPPATRNLGLVFDYSWEGPGIRIKEVPRRSPGSFAKTRIAPGEYLMAVDGADAVLDEAFLDRLADRGDRDVVLLVNSKPSKDGARTVSYKSLTGGEWNRIWSANRIDSRRRMTDTLSSGRIGYVHIAGMGMSDQTVFEKEFFARAEGKDAMVIDVRENGGGNIGDRLISWLANKPYGTYLPRGGTPKAGPPDWAARTFPGKPIVVLMGEGSYSNAEMFPYGMRATGLARLVGKPTPGYVIWTNGLPLVDGTQARMPFGGTYRRDGSPLENLGEKPDFDIDWPVEDWLAGKDPQLVKAIELLRK